MLKFSYVSSLSLVVIYNESTGSVSLEVIYNESTGAVSLVVIYNESTGSVSLVVIYNESPASLVGEPLPLIPTIVEKLLIEHKED